MSQTTIEDRCRGVLIGLAAGDRIGGPIRMTLLLPKVCSTVADRREILRLWLVQRTPSTIYWACAAAELRNQNGTAERSREAHPLRNAEVIVCRCKPIAGGTLLVAQQFSKPEAASG